MCLPGQECGHSSPGPSSGVLFRTVAFPSHKMPESNPSDSGIKDLTENILINVVNMYWCGAMVGSGEGMGPECGASGVMYGKLGVFGENGAS